MEVSERDVPPSRPPSGFNSCSAADCVRRGFASPAADSSGCNLSSVDLSGNQQLTSTCIRHLTELCGPRLRSLNVAATRVSALTVRESAKGMQPTKKMPSGQWFSCF